MKKKLGFYHWVKMGFVGLFIFMLTCIRPIREIGFSSGFQPFLYDGTMQHKVGELFLWIPFFYIGLSTFNLDRTALLQLIERCRWPMFLGGLLNLISWFSLKGVVWWHPFCWVIFLWGVFAVPLCKHLFLPRAINKGV